MNKKAISPIISFVLLVVITMAGFAGAFVWFTQIQTSLEETTGEQAGNTGLSCNSLEIITFRGDGVTVRNNGCGVINNVTVVIDDVATSFDLTQPLNSGDAGVISLEGISAGEDHCIKILLNNGKDFQKCTTSAQNTVEAGFE